MKRPLEQIPQPESKRLSLGEDPSFEHGVLAAEELRWLPRQRSRKSTVPTDVLGIPIRQKREGQCLLLAHKMR